MPKWAAYADQIEALMERNPETKLRELQEALDTDLSLPTLCRALQALHWSKYMPKSRLEAIYERIEARERAECEAERRRSSRQENRDWMLPF